MPGTRNVRSAGDRWGVDAAVVVVAAQMGDLAKVAEEVVARERHGMGIRQKS